MAGPLRRKAASARAARTPARAPAAPPPRRARQGVEEVRSALAAAVVSLLAQKSADAISVKEIAALAGVNHGLVHRHFGSKEALLREAVSRINEEIRRDFPPEGAMSWSARLQRERPELARILARCCLDGPRDLLALATPLPEQIDGCIGHVRSALAKIGLEGAIDPAVVNAAGVAMLLGWVVFRPFLEAGYRLPPDADAHFAQAAAMIDGLLGRVEGL